MSNDIPYRLANGVGNPPDAAKFMADYDWLTALIFGNHVTNGGFEDWVTTSHTDPAHGTEIAPNWTLRKTGTSDSVADVDREATTIDEGTYSAFVDITSAGSADSILAFDQAIPDPERFNTLTMAVGFRVKVGTGSKVRVHIDDGTNDGYSSYHDGDNTWQTLIAVLTLQDALTALTASVEITSDFTGDVFIDGAFAYIVPANMTSTARSFLRYSQLLNPSLKVEGGTLQGALDMDGFDIDNIGNADVESINSTFIGYGRNRIVNGAMRFDQRNEGTAYTNSGGGANTLDCWRSQGTSSAGVYTVTQATATPPTGFTHYKRITVTTADASIAAGDQYYLSQRIEGNRIRDFLFGSASAKTVTLSFWVRSSVTGTFSGALSNAASDRSYPFTYTINAADTWELKSATVTGETTGTWLKTTGLGMHLYLNLGSGSTFQGTAGAWANSNLHGSTGSVQLISTLNATWDITGVQLEIGSTATSFEYLPDGVELGVIQRYLVKTFPIGTAAVQNSGTTAGAIVYRTPTAGVANRAMDWRFPNQMRAAPTVTFYNPAAANSNWRNVTINADSGASTLTSNISAGANGISITNAQAAGDGASEALAVHGLATAEL